MQNTELTTGAFDPGLGRALEALRSLLIPGEQLEAYVIQRRLFALIHRRAIVGATTGRFIAVHRPLFGGFDPQDVRWQDLHDVSLHVGIFGATLSITVRTNTDLASAQAGGRTLTYTGLGKTDAQAVYRLCQSNAQAWREKRRVRDLEELRAKSGGIQLSGGGGPAAQFADTDGRSPTARLARAKEMLAGGLLNDAEFEQIKARILAEL
ncbi:MAG: PH domain-containing protein [Gemmatimonadales bacterium]